MMAKGDEEEEVKHYPIKLESMLDMARYVFSFGVPKLLLAVPDGKKYRAYCSGEKLGDYRISYYAELDKIGRFCIYAPKSESHEEKYEIRDEVGEERYGYKIYKTFILELNALPFEFEKSFKGDTKSVMAKDHETLIASDLSFFPEGSGITRFYAFRHKNARYIASLAFAENSMFYAKFGFDERTNFLSYDYTTDRVSASEILPDGRALAAIINLTEAFPFFKG